MISWIMGSQHSGSPVWRFQNTVASLYGVIFHFCSWAKPTRGSIIFWIMELNHRSLAEPKANLGLYQKPSWFSSLVHHRFALYLLWAITPLWNVFVVREAMNPSTYEPMSHEPTNPCHDPILAPITNHRGFHHCFIVVLFLYFSLYCFWVFGVLSSL